MAEILDRHAEVTAVFAASDEILIGALGVLRDRALRVGDHLSHIKAERVNPEFFAGLGIDRVLSFVAEAGERVAIGAQF